MKHGETTTSEFVARPESRMFQGLDDLDPHRRVFREWLERKREKCVRTFSFLAFASTCEDVEKKKTERQDATVTYLFHCTIGNCNCSLKQTPPFLKQKKTFLMVRRLLSKSYEYT